MKTSKTVKSFMLTSLVLSTMGITALATGLQSPTGLTNPAERTTPVEYVGLGVQTYEVTVPAILNPDANGTQTADVYAKGTFPTTRQLKITVADAETAAANKVTLTCDLKADDKKLLDVTFADFILGGDNTVLVEKTAPISVQQIEEALFGEWTGTIVYTIGLEDVTP